MSKSLWLAIMTLSASAYAADFKGINFQASIKRPDGSYPSASGVLVNVKILSRNDCILREENFNNVSISNGYLYLVIGKGVVTGADPSLEMTDILNNTRTFSGLECLEPDGSVSVATTSYSAQDRDSRKVRLNLTIDGVPIEADFNMRSVAFAVNSETLNGKKESDFLAVNSGSSVTQAALEQFFTTIVQASGNSIRWNGSSFVAYDPNDGSALSSDSVPASAIVSLPWSKLTSVPAGLEEIGGLSCADGKILAKVSGVWSCADPSWSESGANLSRISGFVGIGNASPLSPLDVVNNAAGNPTLRLMNQGSASFVPLGYFLAPNLTSGQEVYFSIGQAASTSNAGSIGFKYFGSGSGNLNRLDIGLHGQSVKGVSVVDNGGQPNVGIGRNGVDPASKLSVNGSASVGTTFFGISAPVNGLIVAGNMGVGLSNPTEKFQVAGVIAPAVDATHDLGTGSLRFRDIHASNGVIQTSDRRFKKDIQNSDLGLDFINSLRPVSYRWISGGDGERHYGLIAQEAELAIRSMREGHRGSSIVTHDKKSDRYGVRYVELIAPLIKAIQELFAVKADKVEVETKLRSLASENVLLKSENQAIKSYLCSQDPESGFCQ